MFHLILLFVSLQFPGKNNTTIIWTAGWSHDDKYIATGNDKGEVTIYETTNWTKIKSWCDTGTTITKIEWNPKYPLLAVTGFTPGKTVATAQIYDMETNKTILLPDSVKGRGVSWKPDGEQVAFVTQHGYIGIYSRHGIHLSTLSVHNPRGFFDIDWHPQTNLLLAVEENIYYIDMEKDRLLSTFINSPNKGILCGQWHPDGNSFATGDYGHGNEGGEPSWLKVWSFLGSDRLVPANSKSEYRNIRWSSNGKYLAAAGDVLILADSNRVNRYPLGKDNIWALGWNSTNDKLVTGDQAGVIRICTVKGKVLQEFRQ